MGRSGPKVKVVVLTAEWRLEGDLHISEGGRATDALNAHEKEFLVITDARIYCTATGGLLAETKFVDVNRMAVLMVYQVD